MAKALFGHVAPARDLRLAEEVATLRSRVARLELQVAELRAERDAVIARELLAMAHPEVEPALAR